MKQIPLACYSILLLAPFAQAEMAAVDGLHDDFAHAYLPVSGARLNDSVPSDRPIHADLSAFADEAWILPVSSSRLSPGQITPRPLQMPGLQPFFLVGDDSQSLAWLHQHAATLGEMGAAGLAVEVADTEALSRIRAAVPGITILPVNGNDIATHLQIEHYPVLVTATSLEQ
ncbi:integrating conjugative element protein [Pseudomonas proteolytica]|uniref:integrating conjugative element protein n=1 Tax=Pseudomonas proteolytica TaxID=219574 RepID=UPI00320A00F7